MSVCELRDEARAKEISGVWNMNKQELVDALAGSSSSSSSSSSGGGGGRAAEREMAEAAGKSGKVVHDPSEEEDREGQTLVTRDHDVIRQWAEGRGAEPATVDGTEHGDHLGVLRFDFPGYGGQSLRKVSW